MAATEVSDNRAPWQSCGHTKNWPQVQLLLANISILEGGGGSICATSEHPEERLVGVQCCQGRYRALAWIAAIRHSSVYWSCCLSGENAYYYAHNRKFEACPVISVVFSCMFSSVFDRIGCVVRSHQMPKLFPARNLHFEFNNWAKLSSLVWFSRIAGMHHKSLQGPGLVTGFLVAWNNFCPWLAPSSHSELENPGGPPVKLDIEVPPDFSGKKMVQISIRLFSHHFPSFPTRNIFVHFHHDRLMGVLVLRSEWNPSVAFPGLMMVENSRNICGKDLWKCWNDGNRCALQGAKVKIYLQLPEGTLQDASQVTCDFQDRSFHLQARKRAAISTCMWWWCHLCAVVVGLHQVASGPALAWVFLNEALQ